MNTHPSISCFGILMPKRGILMPKQRGAAYILAIVTLLVGMTLALVTLQMGNAYFLAANSRTRKASAANLAKAGMEYALWQVKANNATLPLTCDVTLNTGRFHVEATDDGLFVPGGMLIKSTGTSASDVYTVQRVLTNPNEELPYSYLWCQKNNISFSTTISTSGSTKGIRCNGNMNLSNASNSVTNGAWATGTITTAGSVSPKYAGSSDINMPLVSAPYYMSIANQVKSSGTTINVLQYPNQSQVIYVQGGCTIDTTTNGKYDGKITVFAEGAITVVGNLQPNNASSHIAVISATGIVVDGANVQAVFYSCNDGAGYVSFLTNVTLTGAVAADSVTSIGTLTLYTDSGLDATVLKELHLPGT